jgi:hypothetical protein
MYRDNPCSIPSAQETISPDSIATANQFSPFAQLAPGQIINLPVPQSFVPNGAPDIQEAGLSNNIQ